MIISVFDKVQNVVGKGENAGYQHFLLFPQCFEKASFPDTSEGVIVWKWVKKGDRYMYQSYWTSYERCITRKFELMQKKN